MLGTRLLQKGLNPLNIILLENEEFRLLLPGILLHGASHDLLHHRLHRPPLRLRLLRKNPQVRRKDRCRGNFFVLSELKK